MGTKRIGLARVEKLLENLKREIDWGTSSSFENGPMMRKKAGSAGDQADTTLIIGKNGAAGGSTADPLQESSTQLFPLGTRLIYNDRTFRYGKMGSGAVTAGKVLQQAAELGSAGDHQDLAMAAGTTAAAGVTVVSIDTAGTDLTANQYAEGYLYVNDGTGEGQCLRIKSHPAHDHSDDATVVITLHDKIVTALNVSNSKITISQNPYGGLIVAPHTETGAAVGVTTIDMTAAYYGWFQTGGPAAVLTSGTLVIGNNACRALATTDGAVLPNPGDVNPVLGWVMVVNVTTDYSLIYLTIE
jgi:hypothetical protein